MTLRLLRMWMFAFPLVGALALAARAGAAPPDLPIDPHDTIPLLEPLFPMTEPEPEPEATPKPQPPRPEPLPAWPTIKIKTFHSCPFQCGSFIGCGDVGSYGIWTGASCMNAEDECQGELTLTAYPGPNGVIVSIDPEPKPQTITVYHAVRPLMPLSVQRTFETSLLFGAHPLLSLVPLPESLREERHTHETIAVPTVSQTNGAAVFGIGVNSDAGLQGSVVSSPAHCEPTLVTNGFAPANQFNVATQCSEKGILPCPPDSNSVTPDLSIPVQSCPFRKANNSESPGCASTPFNLETEFGFTFEDNLANLIEAEKLYQAACKLVAHGKYSEALVCLTKARDLCSKSQFEEMAAAVLRGIVCDMLGGDSNAADTEEQEAPPDECVPLWYGNDDDTLHYPTSAPAQKSCDADSRQQGVYLLRNASATDVAKNVMAFLDRVSILKGCIVGEHDDEVVVVPEPITNKLLISATPRYYSEVMHLIQKLDEAPLQVRIQALVAEVDLGDGDECGGDHCAAQTITPHLLAECAHNGFVFSAPPRAVKQMIRALKTQGRLDVLCHPQVQTQDNQSARVFIGSNYPIITGTTVTNGGFAEANVTYEPVGVAINVTPGIEPDGVILLRVSTEVSTTEIKHDAVESTVAAKDGETVVIVGPKWQSTTKTECKSPCCELSWFGKFFCCRNQTISTSHLVICLTPHIVRPKENANEMLNQESKPLPVPVVPMPMRPSPMMSLPIPMSPPMAPQMPLMPMMMPPQPPFPMMMPPQPPFPMMPPPVPPMGMMPQQMPLMPMMPPAPPMAMMPPQMPLMPPALMSPQMPPMAMMPPPAALMPPVMPPAMMRPPMPPVAMQSQWAVRQLPPPPPPPCVAERLPMPKCCGECRDNLSGVHCVVRLKSCMERKLNSPVTVDFNDVPLKEAIKELRVQYAVNFDWDDNALADKMDQPFRLQLNDVMLKTVLELMVKKCNLGYIVHDEYIEFTTREKARGIAVSCTYPIADLLGCNAIGCETSEKLVDLIMNAISSQSWSDHGGKGTIDYFPVAGALVIHQTADVHEQVADLLQALRHVRDAAAPCVDKAACTPSCEVPCKVAGVDEQVTGLLKACHLALGCGRYTKAIQLAREAHALDAERVGADPVVYKMHLLSLKTNRCCDDPDCCGNQGCCCGVDCPCGPDCPCGQDCCCPSLAGVKGCVVVGRIVHTLPLGAPHVCVEMIRPALPPVDAGIVGAMQKLLEEAEQARAKAQALEVVEEESEATTEPKSVVKPFRVVETPAAQVMCFDEMLKFLPGEIWTEYDPKSNHVRGLWRVRLGSMVYRVRYDGDLSIDFTVTPTTDASPK